MNYIDITQAKNLLPKNSIYQHKGDCGRVMICGGSIGMTGAVCMAASAALRTGSGLVTVAVPKSLNSIYEIKLTEVMSLPIDDSDGQFVPSSFVKALEFSESCDAVAIGPGGGKNFRYVTESFIHGCGKPMVIDADGLNSISCNTDILLNKKADIILTPHVGEMSRLTGKSTEYINHNRVSVAEEFAEKYSLTVVLKGHETVVTNGEATFINTTGNDGMATGGAGDVLCGMILSFLGRQMTCFNSCLLGVYLHGLAGDIARNKFNAYSLTASDIISNIPEAINKLL